MGSKVVSDMFGRTEIGLLERDFLKRVHASLGDGFSRGTQHIEVSSLPVDDPRIHSTSHREHFLSTKTSLGLDLILYARVPTHKSYIPMLYAIAALSISRTIAPVFLEAATIIKGTSPFSLHITKDAVESIGPVSNLIEVDSRFQNLLQYIKVKGTSYTKLSNTRVSLDLDMPFEIGVIPIGERTMIAMRCVAEFRGGLDNVGGVLPVFNYGFPRPALEMMGRLAYYTEYLNYSGLSGARSKHSFLIEKVLQAKRVLEEEA